jgi:putative endonuclease
MGERDMAFWVYILASDRNGTLYTGQTDQLAHRTWEHREKIRPGFTSKYSVTKLVWFEAHPTREGAKIRERQIKEWKRVWKLRMIDAFNPEWKDLYLDLQNWYSPDMKV